MENGMQWLNKGKTPTFNPVLGNRRCLTFLFPTEFAAVTSEAFREFSVCIAGVCGF